MNASYVITHVYAGGRGWCACIQELALHGAHVFAQDDGTSTNTLHVCAYVYIQMRPASAASICIDTLTHTHGFAPDDGASTNTLHVCAYVYIQIQPASAASICMYTHTYTHTHMDLLQMMEQVPTHSMDPVSHTCIRVHVFAHWLWMIYMCIYIHTDRQTDRQTDRH